MCRFKFAVPIVVDMRDLCYRRLQYDMADSEIKRLCKTEYKENPLSFGSGFFYHRNNRKPNNLFVTLSMILHYHCFRKNAQALDIFAGNGAK